MKKFSLKLRGRKDPVEFTEDEVRTYEDFCDPEREELAAMEIGAVLQLDDGAEVTRTV